MGNHMFSIVIVISIFVACQSALEGRAVVNLQMGNTFGAFVDMNDAIKVGVGFFSFRQL